MSAAEDFAAFAAREAAGRSARYEQWAGALAADPVSCAVVDGFPPDERQPNLWLAAIRVVHGEPEFSRDLLTDPAVQHIVRTHRTQTNEPARCATLLPLLAALPQPLALLEIGASAGLCLLPDRYGYDYAGTRLGEGPPVFGCDLDGPVPTALPKVVWRRGLDLHPLDPVADADWLRALVWPGQDARLARLDQALAVAAADPPLVVAGDLRTDLASVAAGAPADATLVVFHTAVLSYVPGPDRAGAVAAIRATGGRWIANEGPRVLTGLAPDAPDDGSADFVLRLDGIPLARTDGHGSYARWL